MFFCSRSLEHEKVEEPEPLRSGERTTGRAVWAVVGVCLVGLLDCFELVKDCCWVVFVGFWMVLNGFGHVLCCLGVCWQEFGMVFDGFLGRLLYGCVMVFGLLLIVFWVPGA